jgi:hypothetical protein
LEKVEAAAKDWRGRKQVNLVYTEPAVILKPKTGADIAKSLLAIDALLQSYIKMFMEHLPKYIDGVDQWINMASKNKTYKGTDAILKRLHAYRASVGKEYSDLEEKAFPYFKGERYGFPNLTEAMISEMTDGEWEDSRTAGLLAAPLEYLIEIFPGTLSFPYPGSIMKGGFIPVVFSKQDVTDIKNAIEKLQKNYEKVSTIVEAMEEKVESIFTVLEKSLQTYFPRVSKNSKSSEEKVIYDAINNLKDDCKDTYTEVYLKGVRRVEIDLHQTADVILSVVKMVKHSDSFLFSKNM